MKTHEAHTSLKQGLYKLYLFKSLKDGIELKDIKEEINTYIKDDSIGAGYRNLVRDYVKADLVKVEDKNYCLTDKGKESLEELSQNLVEYTKDFNHVPPPTLSIDNSVIDKFDFKDYPLEIVRYFSSNPSLNNKLAEEYENSNTEFQKHILEALVFSDYEKVQRLKVQFQNIYNEKIKSYVSNNVINFFKETSLFNTIKISFAVTWFLRLAGIFVFANLFGNTMAMQVMKLCILFFFGPKLIEPIFKNLPKVLRSISFATAYSSIFIILSVYYMNTKTTYGISLNHIRLLDTLLITLLSAKAISFFTGHIKLKGLNSLKAFTRRFSAYQRPIGIFLSVALLLFFHITYDILTAQLASIVSVISLIPMIIGIDLFEQFENIQGTTLDIHNN